MTFKIELKHNTVWHCKIADCSNKACIAGTSMIKVSQKKKKKKKKKNENCANFANTLTWF